MAPLRGGDNRIGIMAVPISKFDVDVVSLANLWRRKTSDKDALRVLCLSRNDNRLRSVYI